MTYATDTFTGDGSTVEFTLTFDYIQRDHVKVYRVVTATEAETELTVITSGDPGADEYIWETDDKIKVGTAPTTDQQLSIRRETPENEQIVDWADGSYIIAQDLNTADRQFLYGIQELDDRVDKLDTESIKFKGTVDLTTDDPPANPANGDLFVNSGSGTVKEGWTGIVGDDVVGAEQVLWSSTDEEWSIIDTPASQSGVLGVTGTAPITVDNTDDQNPVVGIDAATTSAAGSMSSADKTKLDGVATGAEVNVNADWDATSGDAEILNKPTIPAAQVQSDWNQTDTAAVDFIENKPTIPAAQIQSDWDQTDTAALDFIQNKPDVLDDAPSDGNTYGREDGAWVEVTATGGVTSIVAGDNITIDPTGGTGDVTINSTGGGDDDTVGASAWGSVDSDGTLDGGLNIASVTRDSVGGYSVVFASAMPDANYSVTGSVTVDTTDASSQRFFITEDKTATGFKVITKNSGDYQDYAFNFAVHATNGAAPLTGGTGTDSWAAVQSDGTIDASFNVDSVTRDSTGLYDVVFTTAMPTSSYAVVGSTFDNGSFGRVFNVLTKSTTGMRVGTFNSGAYADIDFSFTVNATNAQLPNTLDEETIRAAAQNPGASAWGYISGDTGGLTAGMNVASVNRTSEGVYDVTFANAMPSADYAVVTGISPNTDRNVEVWNQATTGFTTRVDGTTNGADINFVVFATNALPVRRGTGTDAWGTCQSDGTIDASFNIDSVTRTGTGEYAVVFTTAMPTANYSVTGISSDVPDSSSAVRRIFQCGPKTTTGFDVYMTSGGTGAFADFAFDFQVNATNATLPTTFTEEQIQGVIDAGPEGIAKAWLNCDSDGNVAASYNIDSVTDNGTGDLTVTFTDNMADTNYLLTGGAIYSNGTTGFGYVSFWSDGNGNPTNKTASECRVQHGHAQTGTSNAQNVIQITNSQEQIYMIFYGN